MGGVVRRKQGPGKRGGRSAGVPPIDARLAEDGNGYVIGGRMFPRLSSTLGEPEWVGRWKERVGVEEAERIARETAMLGGMVHKVTELWDTGRRGEAGRMMDANPWLVPYLMMWREWVEKVGMKWVWVEKIVWSEELRVAGTLDRMGRMGGGAMCVVDIKTSSGLHGEYGEQAAGYRRMVVEMVRRGVVRGRGMVPERLLVVGMPGPREAGEGEVGEVIEGCRNPMVARHEGRVVVKEYDVGACERKWVRRVEEWWALRT